MIVLFSINCADTHSLVFTFLLNNLCSLFSKILSVLSRFFFSFLQCADTVPVWPAPVYTAGKPKLSKLWQHTHSLSNTHLYTHHTLRIPSVWVNTNKASVACSHFPSHNPKQQEKFVLKTIVNTVKLNLMLVFKIKKHSGERISWILSKWTKHDVTLFIFSVWHIRRKHSTFYPNTLIWCYWLWFTWKTRYASLIWGISTLITIPGVYKKLKLSPARTYIDYQ